MGERKRYRPGTFCWVDLATTDAAGARAFYGELFGWEAADMPAGETAVYTMLRLDGDDVGGLYEMDAAQREQGAVPAWLSYVSVEDADASASRALELGGKMMSDGAFDVLDAGRMALVQDPVGAMIAFWQPGRHIGARRVNDPGCLTWNELQTREPENAASFYSGLFGWKTESIEEDGNLVYVTMDNAGFRNGGIMPMTEEHCDTPPHWLVYFTVSSCDASAAKVRELGGEVLTGPFDVSTASRIAVVRDPQGAAFGLFEGETDD